MSTSEERLESYKQVVKDELGKVITQGAINALDGQIEETAEKVARDTYPFILITEDETYTDLINRIPAEESYIILYIKGDVIILDKLVSPDNLLR